MQHRIIGIDVDEVCADLHGPWIRWGNAQFGTSYTHFPDWDAPEKWWGPLAFAFLTPEIYSGGGVVRPHPGAREAVDLLRALGYRIRFVTSCSPGSEEEKLSWLFRHGFTVGRNEFIPGRDKSGAPVDLLVDDSAHNCRDFAGEAFLVARPHNRFEPWGGKRITHLAEVPGILIRRGLHSNHPHYEIQEANDGR